MGVLSSKIKPNKNILSNKYVLGLIDPQNDFFINGSLAVPNAEEIIGPINKLRFYCNNICDIFISQDYHPANHMSFATTHKNDLFSKVHLNLTMKDNYIISVEQCMWPVHCVKDTWGSKFHQDLILQKSDKIFRKGTMENIESYSAFGDEFNSKYENTELDNWLKANGINNIILVGLATDYCVYHTALDAIRLEYKVHIILSCVRGVSKDTTENAIKDLKSKGVIFYDNLDKFFQNKELFL